MPLRVSLSPSLRLKIFAQFLVPPVCCPARGRSAAFEIFRVWISAALNQESAHLALASRRSVMNPCSSIVEASRDRIDLRTFTEQNLRSLLLPVHTRIEKCVVYHILRRRMAAALALNV